MATGSGGGMGFVARVKLYSKPKLYGTSRPPVVLLFFSQLAETVAVVYLYNA